LLESKDRRGGGRETLPASRQVRPKNVRVLEPGSRNESTHLA
jgi:hypothetical protein